MDGLPFAWVPDVARLEWSLIEAFYATELVVKSDWFKEIASKDADDLRFQVHPSVRLIRSKWPIPEILKQLELNPPANLPPMESFVLVYRHEDFHFWEEIEAPYFGVLQKIAKGCTLDEATSHLEEGSASGLSNIFSHWVERGILSGISEVTP